MENRHFSEGLQVKGCYPCEFGKVRSKIIVDAQAHRSLLFRVMVKKIDLCELG
jgi:hypothetical protein